MNTRSPCRLPLVFTWLLVSLAVRTAWSQPPATPPNDHPTNVLASAREIRAIPAKESDLGRPGATRGAVTFPGWHLEVWEEAPWRNLRRVLWVLVSIGVVTVATAAWVRSLQKQAAALNGAAAAVGIMNREGNFLWVNPA